MSTPADRGTTGILRGRVLPALVAGASLGALAACDPPPPTATFIVDTASDGADATPGDGLCATATGSCTLRAAAQESNADPTFNAIRLAADPVLSLGPVELSTDIRVEGDQHRVNADGSSGVLTATTGRIHLRDVTIEGGSGGYAGGGGLNQTSGSLVLERVTFANNTASGSGGAVSFSGQLMVVADSTFHHNSTTSSGFPPDEGHGGAIYADQGKVYVANSTFTGNKAAIEGAAVSSGFPFLTNLTNEIHIWSSTFVDNGTTPTLGRTRWTHCAMATCATFRGGPLDVAASVVAGPAVSPCTADVTSLGYNWSQVPCGSGHISDLTGSDPELGPLNANGGTTLTHQPSSTSPLLDRIPPGSAPACATGARDQRGIDRPVGSACDIGSVERS